MHAGVGAILGVIAGGSIGYFVIDTLQEGIPGQGELQTAVIEASNRAVRTAQSAPIIQRVVADQNGHPIPCYRWEPSIEVIAAMGLSGPKGDAVRGAYAESSQRIWNAFSGPCLKTLGVESMSVIERMGLVPCLELVRAQADADTVEALVDALMVEYSLFLRHLDAGVGNVESERLAASGRLCLDRNLLRNIPTH